MPCCRRNTSPDKVEKAQDVRTQKALNSPKCNQKASAHTDTLVAGLGFHAEARHLHGDCPVVENHKARCGSKSWVSYEKSLGFSGLLLLIWKPVFLCRHVNLEFRRATDWHFNNGPCRLPLSQ
eukprot:4185956-Amphidinium_carterae.1